MDIKLAGFNVDRGSLDELKNILNYRCNGVADTNFRYREYPEQIFFEINNIDNVSQRKMYDNPEHLKQFYIGQSNNPIILPFFIYPTFKPEDPFIIDLGLSRIYSSLKNINLKEEVTFSIRKEDGKK